MTIDTSSTNRGVEAKETELANARLDGEERGGVEWRASPAADSASCLQVVVEKVRVAGRGAGAGDALAECVATREERGGARGACCACVRCGHCGHCGHCGRGVQATAGDALESNPSGEEPDDGRAAGRAAECVEVYRFLRVGGALATGGARRPARVEAWTRRARAAAAVGAAEALGAARLAALLPVHGALLLARCGLALARDAAAGALTAASDYALKPALALLYNAALQPLLVFTAQVLEGARAALAPATLALAECARAPAELLRAVRLVEVRTCACRA